MDLLLNDNFEGLPLNRKKKYFIFSMILLSLLAYLPVNAEWQEDNDKLVEDSPHIKSIQGFGAQLWLTDDTEVFEKWNVPTPGFQIAKVNKAERGKPILPIIIFANPGEKDGLCDVTCDIVVKLPDGEVYGERKNGNCWKGLPSPPNGELQLGAETLGIVIEETDPAGRYTVEAIVKDNIKNLELQLEQYFDVEE